jgi:ATP-dependent RNA helicase DeaD
MQRYPIDVGYKHEVKPGNIDGVIANEAGIDSQYIGRINIHDDFNLVDLPEDMPRELSNSLKYIWVSGQQLQISRWGGERQPKPSNSHSKDKIKESPRGKKKSAPKKTRSEKIQRYRVKQIVIAGRMFADKKNPPALSSRWVNNKLKP